MKVEGLLLWLQEPATRLCPDLVESITGICFLDFIHRPYIFLNHYVSRDGSSLVLRWNLLCWVRSIELVSIGFRKNINAMDNVQKTDPSNAAPSSKTFRDE
jgi:hypothetical protein